MFNKKILQEVKKNLNNARKVPKPKDIDYNSKMGYRDDSPFKNKKSIDIYTKDGSIDMSNTGMPLLANGRVLPPYSGTHKFDTNIVTETPLEKSKKGGSKKYSKSLLAKNRLFAKNPLFKKKNSKNKIYDPSAMYFADGGDKKSKRKRWKNVTDNSFYPQPTHTPIDPRYLEKYPDFQPFIQNEPEVALIPRHKPSFLQTAEKTVNDWLGNPMQKAARLARKRANKGEDPVDNFRHPMAGYYTAQKIGPFGANALGVLHELSTLTDGRDTRPFSNKLREAAEDIYNNNEGAMLSFLPESWAKSIIGWESDNNLLPDGISNPNGKNMYFKKDGGFMDIEIDEADIDKYVKGGYIVEDISIPSLTRMQLAGEVPKSTYTPIAPNYLEENPETYSQIVNKPEVSTEREGSDIGKLRAEFREQNPLDIFLDEKKRQFLKRNKGLNKLAGVTMEKFPEDVLQNFMKEYDYKTNNYAVKKLGKKEGWNPRRRGEWVDELTPGERDAVAESRYGSKLQPSYWSRSVAGAQELVNFLGKQLPGEQGDLMKYNIPGLTKKEQKEIAESSIGALETLAPIDMQGAWLANLSKNRGLTTGSDYKELPGFASGEKMANVDNTDALALNLLTYAGWESIPSLVRGIGRGAVKTVGAVSDLGKFVKDLKTPGTLKVLPTSGNYSFLYKSPEEAGLLVGNPNLNGSQQIFKGVTEAYNKFSRFANTTGSNLGEVKIMQQKPGGVGSSTNIVEGMTLGDMATVGQTVRNTLPAVSPNLLESGASDFKIDKLFGNFRIPTQGRASVESLDNQNILQRYTSDPNVQGISSSDNIWNKQVGPRRKTTQSYNTKGQDAKKAFIEDLNADKDYLDFKSRAEIIPGLETYGAPRANSDWKKFLTPIEDMPDNLGISAPLRDLNAEKEYVLGNQLELQKKFEDGVIEFDEYARKNKELSGQLKTIDDNLATQKIENVEALSDNEVTANIIDDMRQNKIELWQTDEGQKRLQTLIDNTPSLKGQTPNSLIEGVGSMNNINRFYDTQLSVREGLLNERMEYDNMYDSGKISTSEYMDATAELDRKLNIVDSNISELGDNIKHSAFYGPANNEIGITPGMFSLGDLKKVTSHELGHFLGSYGPKQSGATYLDDALKELDLVKPESKQLEIPGLDVAEESKAHDLFGNARPNYVSETLKYFDEGSKGTERVPFLAEVRQDMIEKGLIKSEYDPITPDALKKHYDQYKALKGEKYPLRIYDIIKDKPKNFNVMSKVINNLPMIIGAGYMLDSLSNEDKNANMSEAGIGLFLTLLSRNPNAIKISKRLQGLVNNFNKYGKVVVKEMSMLNKKYINNAIEKLKVENQNILDELGYNPYKYEFSGPKAGLVPLAVKQNRLATKVGERNEKLMEFLTKEDDFGDELNLNAQQRRLRDMMQMTHEYNVTPEGLEAVFPGKFEGVTTTGTKPVTDLSTGEVINAEVKLPGSREEYRIVNGELVKSTNINSEVIISPEYITALKNSRADVEAKIPGAKVFGSSVLVTEAGMPHITGDIDVIITQSDYNKNVMTKFGFVQDYGPAKQHTIYPEYGKEGILDFNIIHEDANGMVKPYFNPKTPDKTPIEIELFRQFYPEKFQEAATKAMVSGNTIEINMPAKEFMAGIDPQVKTVIDSYETSPFNKWGEYNANKEKHILRPDVLIAYGNPEVVAKGQEAYIKSIVGSKGNLGHQFKPEELSDVNENVDALLKMDFKGDILHTAQDPKRMQLALNDYYINNTVFSREISAHKLPGKKYTEDLVKTALTEWFPGKGASFNGIGLNAVQKGNPTHILKTDNPVIGHRQLGLNLSTSDPVAYVESIIKGTSGNYAFTPEEIKIVEELAEKYLPDVKSTIGDNFKSGNILDWYPRYADADSPKNFLNELSEKTGIKAIRKEDPIGAYGQAGAAYASILGKFDDTIEAMMYSLKKYHASPKTLNERKNALSQTANKTRQNKHLIKTKQDYQKIYSILDGGAATLESRLMQTENQLVAAQAYREKLILKMSNADDIELKRLDEEIKKLHERGKEIQSETEVLYKYFNRLHNIKVALTVAGTVGGVGAGMVLSKEALDAKARKVGYIDSPEKIKRIGKFFNYKRESSLDDNSIKKLGGETSIDLELTPEQIKDYISRGYLVYEK